MALHTDTVDGYTCILHFLHHIVDAFTLALVYTTIVVVEQQRIGIGLTGKLESLGNEFIATELEVTTLTIRTRCLTRTSETEAGTTVVGHSLIHHIPSIDHILITVYHRMDVLAQTLIEHLFLDGFTILVSKHPVGKL